MDEETYQLTSTSSSSMRVNDRVIQETGMTRKILRATVVENPKNPLAGFKVALVHQRKKTSDQWEDAAAINLSALKAGEGVRLDLNSEATLKLFTELQSLQAISSEYGVQFGQKIIEVQKIDSAQADKVRKLISDQYPSEMLQLLDEKHPELISKLAAIKIQQERKGTLKEFQASLKQEFPESYWQKFFETNPWIFGYGLRYQFLKPAIEGQPHYGAKNIQGTGGQEGDFLQTTEAAVRFTVLVEIKKPQTPLLKDEYRNGSWRVSDEIVGGVSQLQNNCRTWDVSGSRQEENLEHLKNTYTVEPKAILVVGNSNELDSHAKRTSFELFRRNLHNPDLLTFDELYERAKFIVENNEIPD
ncbi:DUF4263 domain-containing protein [Patescibacteria group bacterium]|nr:DUF4263 domain-containing protein [Patescibacteria group bacterium]MBP9709774.1 DUF4263 domain-containing protein [Patescibacteria group bacterium]